MNESFHQKKQKTFQQKKNGSIKLEFFFFFCLSVAQIWGLKVKVGEAAGTGRISSEQQELLEM